MLKITDFRYQISDIRKKLSDIRHPTSDIRHGFTIIELLIAITVLGIMAVIGVLVFKNSGARSRDSIRKTELKKLVNPIQFYYLEHNNQYPPNPAMYPGTEFKSTDGPDWIPGLVPSYTKSLPRDPKQTGLNSFSRLAQVIKEKTERTPAQPQVAPSSSATISTSFDGYATGSGSVPCDTTGLVLLLEGSSSYRSYLKFPLSAIPSGSVITSVILQYNVLFGGPVQSSLQAYDQNGQTDPESDNCSQRRSNSANDATPYFSNTNLAGSAGVKTITLPASANTDLQTANDAVDRFSLAVNPGSSSASSTGLIDSIENFGSFEAKLIVTYEPSAPPTYPAYPTYPSYPTYPAYPTYPNYPSYPTYPTYPPPGNYYLGYVVTEDRKSYVLWAILEKTDDPQIYTSSKANCKETPPPNTPYNFCIKTS